MTVWRSFCASVLLAFGVPRETVIEDFLKTNIYTADRIERNLLILRMVSLLRTNPRACAATARRRMCSYRGGARHH